MLFPIAPHICEYLWEKFNDGVDSSIESSWPLFDESIIEVQEFELIIQVNGKIRGKVFIEKNMKEDKIKEISMRIENVKKSIGTNAIKKVIFVKDKLINFVI